MADLRALCEKEGFTNVRTYIASGNVLFTSRLAAEKVKAKLEKTLAKRLGKHFPVMLRSADELKAIVKGNPFPDVPANRLLVMFLDEAPPKDSVASVKIPARERLELRGRELYIHFPDGMGKSKLKIPFAGTGTGRNMNTVQKLLELAAMRG
jgi:uncharacterized protein (DUF1697 family)